MPDAIYALNEYGREFAKDISPILRAFAIGRQLMPVNPQFNGEGLGVLNIEQLQFVARSKPTLGYDIRTDNFDFVSVQGVNQKVPIIQDDAVIKRRHWEAYLKRAVPIESSVSADMAKNYAQKDTSLIVMGASMDGEVYEVAGMFNVAKGSVSCSEIGASFGNFNKGVAAAIAKLKSYGVYSQGYNVTCNSFNYGELTGSVAPASGKTEISLVMETLNFDAPTGQQPGRVYQSVDLPAGECMVSPIASQENRCFFDLAETQIPTPYLWYEEGNYQTGNVKMQLLGTLLPRFMHLDEKTMTDPCICKMTGLATS
jgi:hypothetical protein